MKSQNSLCNDIICNEFWPFAIRMALCVHFMKQILPDQQRLVEAHYQKENFQGITTYVEKNALEEQ